jgi:hypothetical protein
LAIRTALGNFRGGEDGVELPSLDADAVAISVNGKLDEGVFGPNPDKVFGLLVAAVALLLPLHEVHDATQRLLTPNQARLNTFRPNLEVVNTPGIGVALPLPDIVTR